MSFDQLEDSDYKPLDPKDIRLPPPMPPSDRLLAAVEAFYSPPSHDRPRNRYKHTSDISQTDASTFLSFL